MRWMTIINLNVDRNSSTEFRKGGVIGGHTIKDIEAFAFSCSRTFWYQYPKQSRNKDEVLQSLITAAHVVTFAPFLAWTFRRPV